MADSITSKATDAILSVAVDAALLAVNVIMSAKDKQVTSEHKGTTDLVTEIDRAAESIIISTIKDHFPTHSILAEESGKQD